MVLRIIVVTHEKVELASVIERATTAKISLLSSYTPECLYRHPMRQRQETAIDEIQLYGKNESQANRSSSLREVTPRMRREKILSLVVQPREPFSLLWSDEFRPRPFRKRQIERQVSSACFITFSRLV